MRPRPPYDFELTARYATHFSGRDGTGVFENGRLYRPIDVDGTLTLTIVKSTGTIESPSLEILVKSPNLTDTILDEAQRQTAWALGTEEDLAPFYAMASNDRHLAAIVQRLHGLHTPHATSVFEALVLAILGQQISAPVARVLRTLLIRTYGAGLDEAGETYYAFPRPIVLAEADVDGLRKIKLTARKSEFVADISSQVASGELDLEGLRDASTEEAVRRLTEIRGVGPWTAHWLLIRSLGHGDGFPHGDLALQRTVGLLANEGNPMTPQQTLDYSERWRPYRSYVTTYLFAAMRSGILSASGE